MANVLTPAEQAAIAALYGARPASVDRNELTLHVAHDDTGRQIRTWTGPKSAWMNQFKAPVHLQIRINNAEKTPAQLAGFEAEWRADHNPDGTWRGR